MRNLDEIIKKTLLNMKYDSKKTLFENKIILSEEDTKSELSWDGSSFDLSINATNVNYNNDCSYSEFSPKRQEFCEWAINKKYSGLPYKTVDECYTMLTEKMENLCKVGGVNYFEFGNHKFTPCVKFHDGKSPLKELVKFSGYFEKSTSGGKDACGSLQYFPEMFEKKDDKVKQENDDNKDVTPNVKTNVIDTKKQSSGEPSNSPSSLNVIVIDDL